ncbi:MAG: type VI secretion system baseplate subunit TssF [Gammaproteobacteria bacterium]|nr:type VI secretion system baseplate subunit TssF [Gammaproteobacteria bacterium]
MNKYYQNELDNLRDLATEFSNAYPTIAPQLNAASVDPDVERILEGVAFLTGKIRQKIDDEFPEFSQGLLKHIFPHYLRPLPSATIVEFTPTPILKNKLDIPKGAYLDSEPVDDVKCRFRTTYDLDVWPVAVTGAKISETSTGKQAIDVKIETRGIDISKWNTDSLKIHLAGDYSGASDLYYILLNFLHSIEISNGSDKNSVLATDAKVTALGFDDEDALLEYPSNAFPAYRLIQEFFLLREKFLFIELKNLSKYTTQITGNCLTLRFNLNEIPIRIPRINEKRFVLNATPAVNLFEHDAESILNDHKRSEYRIRPLRDPGNNYHIYSINSVIGTDRKTARKNEYKELGLSDPDRNSDAVYQVSYRQGDTENKTNAYLSFSYPPEYQMGEQETVLIGMTCSNGNIPSNLRLGDICKRTKCTPELVEFKNIMQPSDSQRIPSGKSMLWRLLSHLSLNYLSLAEVDNFKALLGLYIFTSGAGNKQEAINRKCIEGVVDIKVAPCDRLVSGIPMRGQAINVHVNSKSYSCSGDMYLFGMLLDYLFGSFASLNSFTEFTMTDSVSDVVFKWAPRTGDRPLI